VNTLRVAEDLSGASCVFTLTAKTTSDRHVGHLAGPDGNECPFSHLIPGPMNAAGGAAAITCL
jgi:hypothetical protein